MIDLGKILQIPMSLRKHAAMAVCSCRTGRKSSERISAAELQVRLISFETTDMMLVSRLTGNPESTKTAAPNSTTVHFVEDALHEVRASGRESPLRFIAVLKMALKQDFSLLHKEAESGRVRHTQIDKSQRKVNASPFLANFFRGMIHKKKKQSGGPAKLLQLPMFGGNAKLLQESDEIGTRFKVLSVRFNPCVIEIDYEATGIAMAKNIQRTIAKVWCKDEHYHVIHHKLFITAKTLQERLSARHRQQRMGFKVRTNFLSIPFAHLIDPELAQETLRDDFSRKHKADSKDKDKMRHRKKVGSIKCLHCHITFNSVPTEQSKASLTSLGSGQFENDHNVTHSCRYHPGFQSKRLGKWSCCLQDFETYRKASDIAHIHMDTGCVNDQSHVWRYNVAKIKNKENKFKTIAYSQ
ncbi:hypothetical protein RRG08_024992 [Elysia crispata]|uniref:Uncharacterized protein n=1 Tax=Elysia crispata TaxID=231223 RepID=A0AAE1ATR4_9GAST|nr:hypothetical protein RRG08_024992 [Elysia crispata]